MYAASVPGNAVSPGFFNPAGKQEHRHTERADKAITSNCQGGWEPCQEASDVPPPSAWKRRKDEIWICLRCESSTRALFVCLAGPSIDLSLRLGGRSIAGLRAKANTLHLLGVGSKRPATASCKTVTRVKGWMEADVRRGSVSLRSLECQIKQFTVQA